MVGNPQGVRTGTYRVQSERRAGHGKLWIVCVFTTEVHTLLPKLQLMDRFREPDLTEWSAMVHRHTHDLAHWGPVTQH